MILLLLVPALINWLLIACADIVADGSATSTFHSIVTHALPAAPVLPL